jgi:hypothetical protein
MGSFLRFAICFLIMLSFGAPGIAQEAEEHVHASPGSEEGLGRAHMEISCSTAVSVQLRYLQTLTESSRKEHLGRFPRAGGHLFAHHQSLQV